MIEFFLKASVPAADTTAVNAVEKKISALKGMNAHDLVHTLTSDLVQFGWTLLKAALIYVVGYFIIKYFVKFLKRLFERRNIDVSLRTFVLSLVKTVLTFILIIAIVSELGVNITSFVALFGAAGLAVGMALSGTLQNFAGGVMILLQRPFRVGDFIEAQGQAGTVKAINLFNTVINTGDNKTIFLPNGGLSTGILNNYSIQGTRRVEWTFGIAYGDCYDKARALLQTMLDADERILCDRPKFIALHSLGDSSVNIVVRAWVDTADYWNVYFDLNEKVYKQFMAAGINIPFPQMDVHLHRAPDEIS